MTLPLFLYAASKAALAMKERKSKSQTGSVLNYGQRDGKGGIVLLEKPGPNDVITTSFMRGQDGELTKLDQPAAQDPQNTYANVFKHEAYPQVPYLPADRWAQVFADEGVTEQGSPGEYAKYMGGLRPFGQIQMSGKDKGKIVSTFKDPKAKSPVNIIWDNIDQTNGFIINEEFFTADAAAKHLEAKKKEYEKNPPIIESVTKQTTLHPTTGEPVNRYSSKKVVTKALLAAKKAQNPDQGFTYKDPVNNEDTTFFSFGSTDRERVRNDMEWIAGLSAQFETSEAEGSVADKFNVAFKEPELAKLRRRMFNNIAFLSGMDAGDGRIVQDYDRLTALAKGELGVRYDAAMKIPGFEKFFFEKVSGLRQQKVDGFNGNVHSGKKGVAFTEQSNEAGVEIIIPAVIPTTNAMGKPTTAATAPYEAYVNWATNRFNGDQALAENLAGNLITYGPEIDGRPQGTLSQPNLELLATAATSPSTQKLGGGVDANGMQLPPVSLSILDTMYLNYAPGIQRSFVVSQTEKERFARNLIYSPDATSYNEKIALVNGFAPRITGTKSGGNLQSLYSWKFRDTMRGDKFSEMQADQKVKQFSGQEAAFLIQKTQATFFTPIEMDDGSIQFDFVTTGTKLAEIGLDVRNITQYVREFGAKAAAEILGIKEGSPFYEKLIGKFSDTAAILTDNQAEDFIGDAIDLQVGQFGSILDANLSDEQIAAAAKRRNQTVNSFMEGEVKARAENREKLAGIIDRLSSSDAKDRNIALRQYYKYMIAYRVASAMQGGTGGRTISDQDVQNVLNFLRMDKLFARGSEEYQILESLKNEMLLMAQRGSALSANIELDEGAQTVFNALIVEDMFPTAGVRLEDLLLEQYSKSRGGFTTPEIGGDGSGGTKKQRIEMTDEQKLKIINDNQAYLTGDSYETLDAAEEALGTATVNRILGQ